MSESRYDAPVRFRELVSGNGTYTWFGPLRVNKKEQNMSAATITPTKIMGNMEPMMTVVGRKRAKNPSQDRGIIIINTSVQT